MKKVVCKDRYDIKQSSGKCGNYLTQKTRSNIVNSINKFVKGTSQTDKKRNIQKMYRCYNKKKGPKRTECIRKYANVVKGFNAFKKRMNGNVEEPRIKNVKSATKCIFKGYNAIKKLSCGKNLVDIPYRN